MFKSLTFRTTLMGVGLIFSLVNSSPSQAQNYIPDLVPTALRMDDYYFYVTFLNQGNPYNGTTKFAIRLTNTDTQGSTTQTNSTYVVPGPGATSETGGISRGLLGLATCTAGSKLNVRVFVDSKNQISEGSNEGNNKKVFQITCPTTSCIERTEGTIALGQGPKNAYCWATSECAHQTIESIYTKVSRDDCTAAETTAAVCQSTQHPHGIPSGNAYQVRHGNPQNGTQYEDLTVVTCP